jgi:hypothetical protein
MSPDDPRHGTYAGAIEHWREGSDLCPPCRIAGRRARKARRLDAIRGNPRSVPLGDEAYAILQTYPRVMLERQTGITRSRLSMIRNAGPTGVVHRKTRDAILRARGWTVIGIQRRLWALAAAGWGQHVIAAECGVCLKTINKLRLHSSPKFIRHDVAEAIAVGYERLSALPAPTGRGPSNVRTRAVRNGWLPPLAWDNIDDADEQPDLGTPAKRGPGRPDVTTAMIENAEWLADFDETLTTVLTRLDVNREQFYQACRRAGRTDLFARLSRREPTSEWAIESRRLAAARQEAS